MGRDIPISEETVKRVVVDNTVITKVGYLGLELEGITCSGSSRLQKWRWIKCR